MPVVIPFMVGEGWFGLTLDFVKGIESTGSISLIPNSQKPLVGLMHKNNKIIPVWSITPAILDRQSEIQHRRYYIDLLIDNQQIAIPVDVVKTVTEVAEGWIPSEIAGLTIYRSLGKNPSLETQKLVKEIKIPESKFYKDTELSSFSLEDI
ncbi:MAG: chemotaxis protein CheW [Brevinema sp.]